MMIGCRRLAFACLPVMIAPLAACGGSSSATEGDRMTVVTSFYPIEYAAQQIGGDRVEVSSLTRPGAEPHDLELTPKQVTDVAFAPLVIYAKGFQPAVDSAVQQAPRQAVLDVAGAAHLDLSLGSVGTVGHDAGGGESETGTDPHFWLDPVRYSNVAAVIAARFQQLDPGHKSYYADRLKALRSTLHALDTDFATTLKSCTNKTIVTSHAAFGYLAQRYGMQQVGVLGISPDQDPTPGRLKAVAAYVKEHKVSTIYSETLASPAVAQTVARETGAKVAVLDPIEGVTADSAAQDYIGIMRADLAALRAGQDCR